MAAGGRSVTSRRPLFLGILLLAMLSAMLIMVLPALAYDELAPDPIETPDPPQSFSHAGCERCHYDPYNWECGGCHAGFGDGHGQGPHGYYMETSNRCGMCHTLHDAGGVKLLPGATVSASCMTCHDGTAGFGVYGALSARSVTVGATHSTDLTDTIPGGDSATGGSATRVFRGDEGNLGCSDCHTPHGTNTVNDFVGDRQRTTLLWQKNDVRHHVTASSKLLKRRPTGSATAVDEYGPDWCLGCHAGRASGGAPHNHPVDSLEITTTPFDYNRVAILDSDAPTGLTVIDALGGWNRPGNPWVDPDQPYPENRGFLMPYPRTAEQTGHYPICQQCHEDSRSVGTLSVDGSTADAEPFTITHEDGTVASDNPRFQNFPHEAENGRFLVETADDLCMNCHPTGSLP